MTLIKNKPYTYIYYDPETMIPFHVGKGTNQRAFAHLRETLEKTDNPEKVKEIQRIISSGKEPIIKIFYKETEDEAFELEDFLSRHWELRHHGGLLTNMQYGGKNGKFVGMNNIPKSEEHKRKIGEGNILANKNPETTKRKSDAAKGNTNGKANKGRIVTWGDKISEKAIERLKDSTKHPMYKKHHTEEAKEKNRQSHLGKKMTEEQKENKSKKWLITFPNGYKLEIKNLTKFCRQYNLSQGNLCGEGHTKGFSAIKVA
jgi:hypothetical protein